MTRGFKRENGGGKWRNLLSGAVLACAVMGSAMSAHAFEASAEAKAEGELVVATAGGFLQEALARHIYTKFTEKTGIRVTPVTINPQEQWAKVRADSESNNVQWDLVNVGPDSLVLHRDYLTDLGEKCEATPNLEANGAEGVCQRHGFLYILGGYILGVNTEAFPNGLPQSAADFFDIERFPGGRALASNESVYNMMIALAADGVAQEDLFPIDIERALRKLDTIKPHIVTWWESSDQAMRDWRSGEFVMSTFFAGRIVMLREEGQPIAPVWAGFPRDISGFGILKDAPHPNAAKAFIDYFFSDEAAAAVLALSEDIKYDPPNKLSLDLPSDVAAETRATYPANWNSMLSMDVDILREQRTEIERAWQEWITR